jgi:hypothetical protein
VIGEEGVPPVIPGLQAEETDQGQSTHEGEEGAEFDGLDHGKVGGG